LNKKNKFNKLWLKPAGISLSGKNIAVVGLGDIGSQLVKRLVACEMNVTAYDPFVPISKTDLFSREEWPRNIENMDFIVFTCSLNDRNKHMLNKEVLDLCKNGVYIVNVARGPLIDEKALKAALNLGKVSAVALDVFEEEPLEQDSILRDMPNNILGSHNGSNTKDAVRRASISAIDKIHNFLHNVDGK
jgi:D-3-phosphoglycerate dehydrogenase